MLDLFSVSSTAVQYNSIFSASCCFVAIYWRRANIIDVGAVALPDSGIQCNIAVLLLLFYMLMYRNESILQFTAALRKGYICKRAARFDFALAYHVTGNGLWECIRQRGID